MHYFGENFKINNKLLFIYKATAFTLDVRAAQ
jgi:hypothetical protein